MSVKGKSNLNKNTNGSSYNSDSEKISYDWAKKFNQASLNYHFNKHGSEIGSHNKVSYEQHAISFANRIDRKHNLSFIDKYNRTFKYSQKTHEFAIINKSGTIISYFKTNDNYFYNQRKEKNK